MLRAKTMKPSGLASRKNARSSAVRSGPAQPNIAARGKAMLRVQRAGGTMTQSDLRLFRVPHTLCACFSSRGPAWTRYHTPFSPRSTRIGCMRRLVSTSPLAVCTLAQVDLATSSLFTEAIWIRQPPVGPDILSIRLAMLGPAACGVEGLSATGGAVAGAAGVVVAGGVVAAGAPVDAPVDALCNGVGGLVASGSGL